MSQIAITNPDRIQALGCLGYTEREASFLCLSALHSGYFLRRQYSEFLAQEDGGTTGQLIEKTLAHKHIQVFTFHHKTQIYHLGARPFYAALGQPDNRNRRQHEPITIKSRLMTLDFVLAHRDKHYLATDQEKLEYFTKTLAIEPAILPAKLYRASGRGVNSARYFVEKYPIFLPEPPIPGGQGNARPVVSFGFVDEGAVTLAGFETFLSRYRPLFAALSQFGLVYAATSAGRCEKARTLFERFLSGVSSAGLSSAPDADVGRLLQHFEARRLYETKQYALFDKAKLIRLRNERDEFSGPDCEMLYGLWQRGGTSAVLEKLSLKSTSAGRISGTFSAYVLEHSYDFFGHVYGL